MWIVGDWNQYSPWTRETGVKMVKGENNVWTGELSLPKGTKFDIKILRSTVSATSGGDNVWSAVRYASTLNNSASHDFGEFTDNLIPNGSFEEGQVKWTPNRCIQLDGLKPFEGTAYLTVGGNSAPVSCASDVFVLPPNQTLRLTGYTRTWRSEIEGVVTMKVVTPQQQTLFEFNAVIPPANGTWHPFSRTFNTADVPTECQIVLSNASVGSDWQLAADFDSLSLVNP